MDDYFTAGPPGSLVCENNVRVMHESCKEVGMPVEPEKDEGPDTTIIFLGLELDTVAGEVRLPPLKLQHLKALIASWRGRKACRKRDLLSLIGVLTHAGKAVRAGRSFTRRLIDLAKSAKNLEQYVRLSREARADMGPVCWLLEWYSMMFTARAAEIEVSLTSDASGNWGCGAHSGTKWFMHQGEPHHS